MIPRGLKAEFVETFLFAYRADGFDAAIEAVALAGATSWRALSAYHRERFPLGQLAEYCQMSVDHLMHGGRKTVDERHVAMWVLRQLGYKLQTIANLLELRNHTTIINGVLRVDETPELLEQARRYLAQIVEGKV